MERGSDKHAPRLDDQMDHETEGLVRGGKDSHAQEWKTPEPPGEDQPAVDRVPDRPPIGGTPPGTPGGMDEADVAGRSELASFLRRTTFPAVRELIIDDAARHDAQERAVAEVTRLPSGREFADVAEVWAALGHSSEQQRF